MERQQIFAALMNCGVSSLYYFSLLSNLPQILIKGILSKNIIENNGLTADSFANEEVQYRRHHRNITLSNNVLVNVHDVVPLYFTSRTPTLYSQAFRQNMIAFIAINPLIICDEDIEIGFSDGNIASKESSCYSAVEDIFKIPWDIINARYWNDFPDGKRQRNAEFFIYPKVKPSYFQGVFCCNPETTQFVNSVFSIHNIPCRAKCQPDLFFDETKVSNNSDVLVHW